MNSSVILQFSTQLLSGQFDLSESMGSEFGNNMAFKMPKTFYTLDNSRKAPANFIPAFKEM